MKITLPFAFLLFTVATGNAQQERMQKIIERNFALAASQYELLDANTPADSMPRTFENGRSVSSDVRWWTSGFFPGSLWLIYEYTKDNTIKLLAEKRLALEYAVQRYTGNHDIGFMIFNSFGNAYRITGNPAYKKVIDTAAYWQIKRFRPAIRAIQSWNGSKKFVCPVIIDNMMNLEQLCWATANGGDTLFKHIAVTHANTTLQNHYRPDGSSWHVVDYDTATGAPRQKLTHQGLADSSAWSRGQAWGLYGFTMMYRFTRDNIYLQQARRIAQFLLHHPHMPEDMIPLWDMDAPASPETKRDASAAAIIASALLELSQYDANGKQLYLSSAEKIIRSLSTAPYLAKAGENGGFLLKHSVGHLPGNSEVDVPLTYADYYFLEAMLRYKQWVR